MRAELNQAADCQLALLVNQLNGMVQRGLAIQQQLHHVHHLIFLLVKLHQVAIRQQGCGIMAAALPLAHLEQL
jgi:hypothetical protein